MTVRGIRVGVPICEDIWLEESEDYENVVECLAETGAEILVVPNGSPYARDKNDLRLSIAVARVTESGLPLIYLNQVGGQDELVFDGASFALNADLSVAAQLPAFAESITTLRWSKTAAGWRCSGPIAPLLEGDKADYAACVLGLRDYVSKNGFPGVLLGVSGGIDSALCAAIAVDALGAERVRGVMLPFRFTAQVSLDDAAKLAKALGIRYEVLPIAPAVNGFEEILSGTFAGLPRDITEENLQARTRGTLLMAISNKTGAMVVTTGNKSEMSVGYATLYGDMNGGFNPIKDIYKTEVFRLSSLRNSWKPDGALGPVGRGHPGQHHHAAADGGAARKPDRPGFAAALRRARCDPGTAGRARGAAGLDRRGGFRPRGGGADRSSAQHRRIQAAAGRARRQGDAAGISAATAAIPSPTGFAMPASRCPKPDDTLLSRAQPRIGGSVRGIETRVKRCARDEGRADRADRLVAAADAVGSAAGADASGRGAAGAVRPRCAAAPFFAVAGAPFGCRRLRHLLRALLGDDDVALLFGGGLVVDRSSARRTRSVRRPCRSRTD